MRGKFREREDSRPRARSRGIFRPALPVGLPFLDALDFSFAFSVIGMPLFHGTCPLWASDIWALASSVALCPRNPAAAASIASGERGLSRNLAARFSTVSGDCLVPRLFSPVATLAAFSASVKGLPFFAFEI